MSHRRNSGSSDDATREDLPMLLTTASKRERERSASPSSPWEKGHMSPTTEGPGRHLGGRGTQLSRKTIIVFLALVLFGLLGGATLASRRDELRNLPAKISSLTDLHPGTTALRNSFSASQAAMERQAAAEPMPRVCVIARTYAGQLSYLPIFLLSLFHTGFPDLRVFLVNTDLNVEYDYYDGAVDMVRGLVGREDFIQVVPIPAQSKGTDWGYYNTDLALQSLYDDETHGCEYVMFTNGDNFYARQMAHHLVHPFADKAEIIGWDFISHYNWTKVETYERRQAERTTVLDNGAAFPIRSELQVMHIDLGAALFSFPFLKQHRLNFEESADKPYSELSDGYFVEKVKHLAQRAWLVRSFLYFHQ